ncbi:PaaI family thioesterase [Hazenella sp. IB182357]|uniref:PaaI family thioesterase n=1 Tax=Polycladospora coralii TaxID=2771432 RepID=A0A926N830_9BACL|nr:PaaI family thioesterase [Polycladospora coralii]MBD1370947.1 PaaI family thioesterase [Polycladospora coralii]MBS7529886.1 PaaI family thioesterase [Polycladospora coralii]
MELQDELLQVIAEGSDEEKEVLALAIQAIKQKRDRNSAFLSGFMGLKGEFVDEDTYEFQIPITSYLLNRAGIVHGGMTATLADSTMGSLINKKLPEGYVALTSEMKINYLKPGVGEKLISRAKILQLGSSLAVATCEVTNEKGKLICFASGTFFVFARKKNGR